MRWVIRILMVVAALILLAVVGLAAAGMRPGAGQMTGSIEIARPPQVVWSWVTEPAKVKQWVSWLVEIEPMDGGLMAPGQRQVWIMEDQNNGGMRMRIVNQVVEAKPAEYLRIETASDGAFRGDASYRLVDLGNGRTRLEDAGSFHFDSWFARLMEPLITPQARKKMESDLARLKQLAESAQ